MSADDNERSGGAESTSVPLGRRAVLKATGLGALTVAGFGTSVAASRTACADGPYQSTHEAGTVNVGQIRADQARGEGPPSLGAGSLTDARGVDDERRPPRQNAQETSEADEGTLTVAREYDGVNSLETRGGVPSDSQIAAGDGQLVHALNRDVAIYNKASGQREQQFRLERLWDPVIPEPAGGFAFGIPFVFDPRARYDRNHDRYILCATQYEPGLTTDGERIDREDLEEAAREGEEYAESAIDRPPRGWFLVAVSATSNPNGEWHVYRVPPVDADGIDNEGLVDYPTLGHDRDAIYLTQNFFAPDQFDVTMVALDKAAMYRGETVSANHFDGMNDPDSDGFTFTVQPAQQPFSGGSDGTFHLVNSDFVFPGPSGTLTLWELTDPLDDPTLECSTLDVDPYFYPAPARQPGTDSLVDTLGTRVMNADFDDGSLWTAHSTSIPGADGRPVAAVRWYEIDADSRSVVQSGTYGTPERSTFMPTVGADDGRAVIVHNVSGPDTHPRMDVGGRTEAHPAGELEDSIVVQAGESGYDALAGPVERWGDYNGVSVDPRSGQFWTVSQYSPDIDIPVAEDERDPYFTRIAALDFDSAPGESGGD